MSWILLEGLDRSGKSTVAEIYKKQGYEVVHMSAPHKKYFEPGYAGPSYLEEMVEMYNLYAGQDVVFDRTVYGELIWPEVFMRMPLLNSEDLEYLAQLEYNQDVIRYLMVPEDSDAHWKRCADNKEPINRIQFVQAARLYDKLELEKEFERKQLSDFSDLAKEGETLEQEQKVQKAEKSPDRDAGDTSSSESKASAAKPYTTDTGASPLSMDERLARANAIRDLLAGKIIKKKDSIYNDIEKDIRVFLQKQLEGLFNKRDKRPDFTGDQVIVLQNMAQRILDKME